MGCLVEDEEVSIYKAGGVRSVLLRPGLVDIDSLYIVAMFHGRNAAHTKEKHRKTLQNPPSLLIIPTAGSRFQRSQLHKSPFVNQINSSIYVLHMPFQQHPGCFRSKNKNGTHSTQPCGPPPPPSIESIHLVDAGNGHRFRDSFGTVDHFLIDSPWAREAHFSRGLVVTRRDSQQTKPRFFFVEETAFGKRKAKFMHQKQLNQTRRNGLLFCFENLGKSSYEMVRWLTSPKVLKG